MANAATQHKAKDTMLFHIVSDPQHIQNKTDPANPCRRYVSSSACNSQLGVEIGFHRPIEPDAEDSETVQRLGVVSLKDEMELVRDPSDALPDISINFLFDTHNAHISVQVTSKVPVLFPFSYTGSSTSSCMPLTSKVRCVYGEDATIDFDGYSFRLIWSLPRSSEPANRAEILRARAIRGYNVMHGIPSVPVPIPNFRSKLPNSAYAQDVRVDIEGSLKKITDGTNGTCLFQGRDRHSGKIIAVKRLYLANNARSTGTAQSMHREIDAYCRLGDHDHISKYLGYSKMNTMAPEIYITLYEGSLARLDEAGIIRQESLVETVMFHMLQALDFLEFNKLCHRDVKPDNILYTGSHETGWTYHFVLADFGLSKMVLTGTTEVGTDVFKAPEVLLGQPNGPKMDIWSLLVTIMKIHPELTFPEAKHIGNPQAVHRAVTQFGETCPEYQQMAQIDPDRRASAREMLEARFNGMGIYVRRSCRIKARTQNSAAQW